MALRKAFDGEEYYWYEDDPAEREKMRRVEQPKSTNTKIYSQVDLDHAATRMRDRCVRKLRERRDKFQAAADASSLPNDLTASRDAAVAAELTRLLGELQSLTLEEEQEKQHGPNDIR